MRLSVRWMAVALVQLWQLEMSASLLLLSYFSKFSEKLEYTTHVKRMYNIFCAYIGIVKQMLCLYF